MSKWRGPQECISNELESWWPKVPYSTDTTQKCRGGRYSIPWIAPLALDPYLIMLSVKQGGIKYHFLSLWYDLTWDWTPVSKTIGEHSIHEANSQAKAGQPAQAYIQQLCADIGYSPEDRAKAMDDREGWQERVRDICADGVTWWWW